MQCSSVDLPEPDGPMIAVYCAALELDVDAVERAHLGVALAVDLRSRCTARAATVVVGGLVVVTTAPARSGARYGTDVAIAIRRIP